MNTITTTLATVATFSNDGKKRYLLRKLWNEKLPSLAIIMLAPSEASEYSAPACAPRPPELSIHSGGIEQSRRGR